MIDLFALHQTGYEQSIDNSPYLSLYGPETDSSSEFSSAWTGDPLPPAHDGFDDGHSSPTAIEYGHSSPDAGAAQSSYAPEHLYHSPDGGTVFGEPVHDFTSWHHQVGHSSCAVVAQMGVYESITHHPMTEQQFCDFAQSHGWYDPRSGTPPQCVGNVLNALGVSTEQHYGGSLTEIADALAHGDKVIVAVNANDIWHAAHAPDGTPLPQPMAGHAVWVTGLNVAPDGTATVYLNDSGTAHGGMMAVDGQDFVNAWKDYGNLTVVARAA